MSQHVSRVHARRRLRRDCLLAVTEELRDFAKTLPPEEAANVSETVGRMEYMAAHPPPVTVEEALNEMFDKEDEGQ